MKKYAMLLLAAVLSASCAGQNKSVISPAPEAKKPLAVYGFRGDGTGMNTGAAPVTEWSEKKNVLWKTKIGNSYSSPVLSEDFVFALSEPGILSCTDKKTGKILWERTTSPSDLPKEDMEKAKTYPSSCGLTTPTPVTDGTNVYLNLANGIVTCFDYSGSRKWIRVFDYEQQNEYGRSSSPVLFAGKLLVTIDHIIALDPGTGKTLWDNIDARNDYATPARLTVGKYDLAVLPDGTLLNIADGTVALKVTGSLNYPSPLVLGDTIYFVGSRLSAVKVFIDEKGALKQELLWADGIEGELCSTGLIYNGLIYAASNDGGFFVYDAKNGTKINQEFIGEKINSPIYGGIVLAGKYIAFSNEAGKTCLANPGKKFDPVSVNELEGSSGSTPVFEGDKVYLRAGSYLYCIGAK
ncbi:MAG: PQQ-binding-like beta-propeller repeat protein [Candidatus Firestonebacteria bacterium]